MSPPGDHPLFDELQARPPLESAPNPPAENARCSHAIVEYSGNDEQYVCLVCERGVALP